MCGICGFNWSDKSLVEDMADIMAHRGPDQQGSFVDEEVSLGHSRLSIIDPVSYTHLTLPTSDLV